MDEKNEELLALVNSASEKILAARDEYVRVCKEENAKVREFFHKRKGEIAIQKNLLREQGGWFSLVFADNNELLTTNFPLPSWKHDAFYIGNDILTESLIGEFQFLGDAERELYNEVAVPHTTDHKLEVAKYAVIIYPNQDSTTKEHPHLISEKENDYRIYIGRVIHEGYAICMKVNKKHFTVYDKYIKDFKTFNNDNDFCEYVSKTGYSNNMPINDGKYTLKGI